MNQNNYPALSDYEQVLVDYYNSKGKDNPACGKCKDKGIIYTTPNGGVRCECQAIRAAQSAIAHSGLTDKLKKCTFATFSTPAGWQQSMKRLAVKFCAETDQWLYIGGQVGSGKTHLCTAVVNTLMEKGFRAKYMVWPDEVDDIKANSEDFTQTLDKLMRVPVLYIDDFLKTAKERWTDRAGAEHIKAKSPPPGELNAAFKLVNSRYNDPAKITIFSSELSIEEVMNFDSGLASRIYERSKKYRIELGQDDSKNMRIAGCDE